MTASMQEAIVEAANELADAPKPNSDSHETLYEKSVYLGRKALCIFEGREQEVKLSEVESLISEMGDFSFDQNDLDREYLLIAYKLTSFGNLLHSFVASAMREREAVIDDYKSNQTEIRELTDAVSKLNAYIEQEVKLIKTESKFAKAAGMAQINLFIFSIPMQSVFDLVSAAKRELSDSSNVNIRYVSSLLTNASAIARSYWKEAKDTLSKIPQRLTSFANSINLQTSTLASKATSLVIKSRIRKLKPRKLEFAKESRVYELANKRDMLIDYLLDFRNWRPKNTLGIFSSSLYLLIMRDRTYFPYSEQIVQDMSKDLVFLQSEPLEVVHNYMCVKAEALIETLSEAIRSIELDT